MKCLQRASKSLSDWRKHHLLCLEGGLMVGKPFETLILHQRVLVLCRETERWLQPSLSAMLEVVEPKQALDTPISISLYPLSILGNGVLLDVKGRNYTHPCRATARDRPAKVLSLPRTAFKRACVVETYEFLSTLDAFKTRSKAGITQSHSLFAH